MTFAWPLVLLLLPLPWLLALRRLPAPEVALRVPDARAFIGGTAGPPPRGRPRTQHMARLAWVLLVLAAARPQAWSADHEPRQVSGRDWLLLFDVSASMASTDLALGGRPVTRLAAAQTSAREFLRRRDGDRCGLIVFAAQPWLYTPLTWDLTAVEAAVGDVDIGLAGRETALGDAIGLAVKRLREGAAQGVAAAHDIVLITDGENTAGALSPQQAAWIAQREGIRLHALQVGGDGRDGTIVSPLAQLAEASGGHYARATDAGGVAAFFGEIEKRAPQTTRQRKLADANELYPWPLTLALVAALGPPLWSGLARRRAFRVTGKAP